MPLTGQAKTDYQRDYMRNRRSNAKPVRPADNVRPQAVETVRPKVKTQSYNPMEVGYVPPIKQGGQNDRER